MPPRPPRRILLKWWPPVISADAAPAADCLLSPARRLYSSSASPARPSRGAQLASLRLCGAEAVEGGARRSEVCFYIEPQRNWLPSHRRGGPTCKKALR